MKNEFTNIVIEVKESWYIYPIPFFWLRENSFEKSSYGINFLYKNFRGRNETLGALLSFGYDPVYSLSYYNPVIIEGEEISLRLAFSYQTMQNRNLYAENLFGERFKYKSISSLIGLGYRLNQFHSISGSLGYNYIKAPDNGIQGITAADNNRDNIISLGVGYTYDSRNLKQFSDNGLYTSIGIVHKGFGIEGVNYNILGIDFREYRNAFDIFTARWRVAFRHTFGKLIPYYDYSYLGYDEIIRGHGSEDREGHTYLVSSVEVTYPLVREWNVSIKLPLIPQKLTSARIGVHLSAFGDSGSTFGRGDALALNKFDSGWGFGLIILFLPYNAFRLEYAFDEYRNGEFLLGTGFSF